MRVSFCESIFLGLRSRGTTRQHLIILMILFLIDFLSGGVPEKTHPYLAVLTPISPKILPGGK